MGTKIVPPSGFRGQLRKSPMVPVSRAVPGAALTMPKKTVRLSAPGPGRAADQIRRDGRAGYLPGAGGGALFARPNRCYIPARTDVTA